MKVTLYTTLYLIMLFIPLFISGEKTFDEIDDLVADGLITLYMEANNVEEYLQTARRKKSTNTMPTASLIRREESGNGVPFTPPPPIPPRGPRHSMMLRPDPGTPESMGTGSLGADPIVSGSHCTGSHNPHSLSLSLTLSPSLSLPPSLSLYPSLPLFPSLSPSPSQYDATQSLIGFHYEKPHNFKVRCMLTHSAPPTYYTWSI